MIKDGWYWFIEERQKPEIIYVREGTVYRTGSDIHFILEKPGIHDHRMHLEGILGKEVMYD